MCNQSLAIIETQAKIQGNNVTSITTYRDYHSFCHIFFHFGTAFRFLIKLD